MLAAERRVASLGAKGELVTDSTRWISVGELAHAFAPDSNSPAATGDLTGTTISLNFEDGQAVDCRFDTATRLTWVAMPEHEVGRETEEAYTAAKVREHIYFVDFVKRLEQTTAISLVIDLRQGIATALAAQLPDITQARRPLLERAAAGDELTAVGATFRSAAIGAPFNTGTPRHEPTLDLVGRRIEYTYSATERYEHVYLNERFYTWHCLEGSEQGLADTDRCHHFKLGDDLYLFVWREKIVPTLGAVVVDLEAMRTAGKIFGYEGGDFSKIVNFAVGAHARVLNVTQREGTPRGRAEI